MGVFEEGSVGCLNVYGQVVRHDDVLLVGDRLALEGLKRGIELVLEGKESVMGLDAGDGKRYSLYVKCLEKVVREAELPYRVLLEGDKDGGVRKEDIVG